MIAPLDRLDELGAPIAMRLDNSVEESLYGFSGVLRDREGGLWWRGELRPTFAQADQDARRRWFQHHG